MPEVAINKHYDTLSTKCKIRPPQQPSMPAPANNPGFAECINQTKFRRSISPRLDVPHYRGTFSSRKNIGHWLKYAQNERLAFEQNGSVFQFTGL